MSARGYEKAGPDDLTLDIQDISLPVHILPKSFPECHLEFESYFPLNQMKVNSNDMENLGFFC